MATHRAVKPPRTRDDAPPALAITSFAFGVIGLACSFWELVNIYTGMAAAVGFAVGLVGIWRSRQILSGTAVVLCGTAVILTLMAGAVADHRVERRIVNKIDTQLDGLRLPLTDADLEAVSDGC